MKDVQKLQEEIRALTEEAELAIGQADRWSETAYIFEQEVNELKEVLNSIIKLIHDAPSRDVNGQDVLTLIYEKADL